MQGVKIICCFNNGLGTSRLACPVPESQVGPGPRRRCAAQQFLKNASLHLGMSSVVLHRHKKKSRRMSDPYQQNGPLTTAQQHSAPIQNIGVVPPPPPPKRTNSAYEKSQQPLERDRHSDGERRGLGDRRGTVASLMSSCNKLTSPESQNLPRTLRNDRNEFRDDYPRTKRVRHWTKIASIANV